MTVAVSGSAPCRASRAASVSKPAASRSISSAQIPLVGPVAIATLARGRANHHAQTAAPSAEASRHPLGTAAASGYLPGLSQVGIPQAQWDPSVHQQGKD